MSFSDHTGQPAVADQLRRSLHRGRLAHAYLFSGPRGSGKEAMAITLAQALNCRQGKGDACGECPACERIARGIHPDLHWVRPESKSRQIKIDQIREFENAIRLKPHSARLKVGIVVEADCLTEQAANAFLKTLEEPPGQTIILLLATEPQRLLPTILSRCLRLSFGHEDGAATVYRARVEPLLVAAGGARGIVDAYRLLNGLLTLLGEVRTEVRAQFPPPDTSDLEPEARARVLEEHDAKIEGAYRAARALVLEEVYTWHSDLLLCVEQAPAAQLQHADQRPALQRAATNLTYDRASAALEALDEVRDALTRNVSEGLALEAGLLKLMAA